MLNTGTLANISVKKVLGVATTESYNVKGVGNEALKTGFSVSASTIFGGEVLIFDKNLLSWEESIGIL